MFRTPTIKVCSDEGMLGAEMEPPLPDLDEIARAMRSGIEIKSRKRGRIFRKVTYEHSFTGASAFKWLIDNERVKNTLEADALLSLMLQEGLIRNVVSDSLRFSIDEGSLYRFKEDEENERHHGKMPIDSNGNISTLWQQFAAKLFDPPLSSSQGDLQPSLPWDDKILHEGVANVTEQIPPIDEHNLKLLNNVHPSPWLDPNTASNVYNLVVLGGGTGGLVSSLSSVALGAKVAIIESNLLGGDCTNFGCVPSKALIRCAKMAHSIRRAAEFGVELDQSSVRVNFAKVMERMRSVRAEISDFEAASRLSSLGIDVYIGKGEFDSPNSIVVNNNRLVFRKCVVATGGKAYIPDIAGLQSVPYLTNESLFNLTNLPESLLVMGGGPIGVEMAQVCVHAYLHLLTSRGWF